MYINDYEFGKANFESVKKIAEHFNNVGAGTPSAAADMDVSGSFMSSLLRRGIVKVAGLKEMFVKVEGTENLYRRYEARLYVLTITASDFWKMYVRDVERQCNIKKQDAEAYVSAAKDKLREVECLLDKVGKIRI